MGDFLSTITAAVGGNGAAGAPVSGENGVMNVMRRNNASSPGESTSAPAFDPSQSYGTPSKLLDNLQQTESSGDPHAVNAQTGAMGAYQFMPATVSMLNKQGVKFDPFNPTQARAAADYYLSQLTARNGGDLHAAVAQYGGFKTQDPSAYIEKVMNGVPNSVGPPEQPAETPANPNAFNVNFLMSAVNQFNSGGNKSISAPEPQTHDSLKLNTSDLPTNLDSVRGGIAGGAAHLLTGLGSSIIGGYQGLAKLAMGGSASDAANAITQYEQDHTYQGELGKASGAAVNLLDSPYNPMNYPGEVAKKGGDVANQLALTEGASPGTAAAIGAGTNAVLNLGSMFLGGKGGKVIETNAALKSVPHVTSSLDALRPLQVEQQARNFVPTPPDLPAYMRKGNPGLQGQSQAETPIVANSTQPSSPAVVSPTESENVIQQMAKQAGPGVDTTAVGRHAEAASLPVPVELTAGQATGDPRLISLEQNNRGRFPALAMRFNEQGNAIAQNLNAIREKVAPDVTTTGVANDQALVDSYKKVDAPIRQDITNKYQALADANGGDMPLSGKDFVSAADTALASDDSGYFLPAEVKNLLTSYRNGENALTFNKFETLRTVLGQAQRAATDGNASHAIGVVRNTLESLPMPEGTVALKPLADAARAAAKARFDKLATDPAYKAAVNDGVPIGEPSPIADQFIRKYVVNGKTANVRNMVNNLSSDPMARQIIGAGVVDHLRSASGLDTRTGAGNVSQAALNKAITGLDQKSPLVFDPITAKTVQTLGNVARYTQEQPRGSFVNNSNTTVAAHAMDFAKSAAEGALNVKAGGVPVGTLIRRGLENRSTSKMLNRSLKPGAGIKISDFPR